MFIEVQHFKLRDSSCWGEVVLFGKSACKKCIHPLRVSVKFWYPHPSETLLETGTFVLQSMDSCYRIRLGFNTRWSEYRGKIVKPIGGAEVFTGMQSWSRTIILALSRQKCLLREGKSKSLMF